MSVGYAMERNVIVCKFFKLALKDFLTDILDVAEKPQDFSAFLTALIGKQSPQVRVFLHICRKTQSITIASNIMMWPLFLSQVQFSHP